MNMGERRGRRLGKVKKGVYILPNLLTTGSLFLGFYSILLTIGGDYKRSAIAILLAILFDSVDGKVARATRTTSHFGIEYDSLSDLVSFGVAPALLVYQWALTPWERWGWLAAFLYLACGALRLARYNVQVDSIERQYFSGLPTPAAAGMSASTILLYYLWGGYGVDTRHITLLVMVYLLAVLMVSTIRYPSFKTAELFRRRPFRTLLFLVLLLTLIVAKPYVMLFLIFVTYICGGAISALLRRTIWRLKIVEEVEPVEEEEEIEEAEEIGGLF